MTVILNSFTPLACNKFGRASALNNNLPFFIDGSCRREPDFQNPNPAITQLCRPKKLVPRLNIGDLVIYITKLGRYGDPQGHWKLIGILEVIDFAQNHNSAVSFYTNRNIPVSQNIICNQTTPYPLNMTHGINGLPKSNMTAQRIISRWNAGYIYRANNYPKLAITKVWENILFLQNPPIITHVMMQNIFGRIPGTQTPPYLTQMEWTNFRNVMNI